MKNMSVFRVCNILMIFFTYNVTPREFVQICVRILEKEGTERDETIFKDFIAQIIKSA